MNTKYRTEPYICSECKTHSTEKGISILSKSGAIDTFINTWTPVNGALYCDECVKGHQAEIDENLAQRIAADVLAYLKIENETSDRAVKIRAAELILKAVSDEH